MSQEKKTQLIVVGFGNMGKALARGLQHSESFELMICDRFPKPANDILQKEGVDSEKVQWLRAHSDPEQISGQLKKDAVVVLATKPQNLDRVLSEWSLVFKGKTQPPLVISILAGTDTSTLEAGLPQGTPVVRTMPNIAATIDQSATAICSGRFATESHLEVARKIFNTVGQTWITNEEHLNAVTGLSGSGPAYIYMVIEALSDGGVKMGLSRQLALELATQTVIGAGQLVKETGLHPAILRDQVTTPGGTTISAIHELEKHGLRPMLIQAVVTATERSAHLSEKKPHE